MKQPDLKKLWDHPLADLPEEEIENALRRLFVRISLYEKLFSETKSPSRNRYILLKIAGFLLLPVAASFLTYLASRDTPSVRETIIAHTAYAAPLGERREFVLEDSTRVCLNSGSMLIAPEKFAGKDRTLYLIGEGYFKVAPDKKKPFKVKTALVEIEALGTEFSVSAYAEDNAVEVVLAEGSVRLSALDTPSPRPLQMYPGHHSIYLPGTNDFQVTEVNASAHTSWKEGVLIFEKTPIADVLRRIEIQYGIQVSYDRSDAHLMKHAITAKFVPDESLTNLLNVLAEIIGFEYRLVNNQIIIH